MRVRNIDGITACEKDSAPSEKSDRPPESISRGRDYVIKNSEVLIFVFGKQTSFMEVLATHTVVCPGNSVQSLFRERFATADTFAVSALVNPFQSLINQVQ